MRKTALTAYGKVGTDWVRMTAALLEEVGTYVFVRADGSNSIVPFLPDTFRTSGDVVNAAARLNHRVSMAAVPSIGLPNHAWKGTFDLAGIAAHFGVSQTVIDGLVTSYASVDEIAA